MPKRFEFCRVCRQNHNQGRGHRYSIKHKNCLELVLGKQLKRIEEVRHFVKNVVPVTNKDQDRTKFWCHFCDQEINEQQVLFVCAQAIQHFASQKHAENVNSFWAEHGGDVAKRHMYVIEGSDLAGWEEGCKAMRALAEVDGPPLNGLDNVLQSDEHLPLATRTEAVPKSSVSIASSITGLAVIQVPSLKTPEGNVHSGAAPPWLKQKSGEPNESFIGPVSSSSHLLPLSRTQERKLAKIRNPNRVGAAWAERRRAELEREQRGETVTTSVNDISSWFPSFGRVWQSGSRRDTRKEFEAEKHLELEKQGRGGKVPGGKKNTTSRRLELKPYISKRQRMVTEVTPK